jgi:hypothetical protein
VTCAATFSALVGVEEDHRDEEPKPWRHDQVDGHVVKEIPQR